MLLDLQLQLLCSGRAGRRHATTGVAAGRWTCRKDMREVAVASEEPRAGGACQACGAQSMPGRCRAGLLATWHAGGTNGSIGDGGGKAPGAAQAVDSKVLLSVAAALQGNSLAQAMKNLASKAQNGDDA